MDKKSLTEIKRLIDKLPKGHLKNALIDAYLTSLFLNKDFISVLEEGKKLVQLADTEGFYFPMILYKLAESSYYERRFEEALKFYKEIETHYSMSNIFSYAVLGRSWTYINMGRQKEARELLMRITTGYAPSYSFLVAVFYGLGVSYLRSAMFDSAYKIFSTYNADFYKKQRFETELAEHINCKNMYYAGIAGANLWDPLDSSSGDYFESAVKFLKKVLYDYHNCEKVPYACYILGQMYFKSEHYDSAVKFFKMAKKYTADSASMYDIDISIAQSYYNDNKIREAISLYRGIKDKVIQKSIVIKGLKECYVKLITSLLNHQGLPLDSAEKILLNFEKDVPESMEFSEFALALAERYLGRENYNKAIEWINKAIKTAKTDEALKRAKCIKFGVLYKLKKWEEIVSEGDPFVAHYKGQIVDSEVLFIIGAAHARLGDKGNGYASIEHYKKAISLLEEFIVQSPKHPWVKVARKLIKVCKAKIQ